MNEQTQDVLNANELFYQAMVTGDYGLMEPLWSGSDDVVVIHPGWPALHGRQAVMDSWRRILTGESTRDIFCRDARCYLADKMAFVICSECFPEGELVATNIFVMEEGNWKIIHHQGGPIQMVVDDTSAEIIH